MVVRGLAIGFLLLSPLFAACSFLNWSDPAPKHGHRPPPPDSGYAQSPRNGTASASGPTYTVQRGDTLYSIAFRNQIDVAELKRWNHIGSDARIYVGQTLKLIPPGGSTQAASPVPPPPSSPPVVTVAPAGGDTSPVTIAGAVPGGAPVLPTTTPSPVGNLPWRWPTAGPVAHRFSPDQNMKGIDITGSAGQPVLASAAGKVVYSGNALKGYGELIIVKHGDEYLTAYGYNRRRLVSEGQDVAAGQAIAEMGTSPEGLALLHFEIRDKGRPVDPLGMLPAR